MPSREEFMAAHRSLAASLDVLKTSADTIAEAFLSVEAEKTGAAGSLAQIKKETEKAEAHLAEVKEQIVAANDAAGHARGEANEWRAQVDQAKAELADTNKKIDTAMRNYATFKADMLSKMSE